MNSPFFCCITSCLFVFLQINAACAEENYSTRLQETRKSQTITPHFSGNTVEDGRQTIIEGTPSSDSYHYWDPQTRSEVWGVHKPVPKEKQPPAPPIFVTPELKWPWPIGSDSPNPGVPDPHLNR